jgi:TolB-like protein
MQQLDPKASHHMTGFFAELMRRRVLHIGGAYIVAAWLGAEIISFLLEQFQAPAWTFRLLAILFVLGFPVAMALAWIIQVQEDGSWAIDPSRGEHKALALAITLGLLITAGLSWLIIPQSESEAAYVPLPDSLAVLPFADSCATPGERVVADTLYRSLITGLEQSGELTLVHLGPGVQADDLPAYGRSLGVSGLAAGQFTQSPRGARFETQMLDVLTGKVIWTQSFDWDPERIIEFGNSIANGLLGAMALPALSQKQFTGTGNNEAFEAYLMGQEHAAAWNAKMFSVALEDYQRAIDLDPAYARAYVGLAQAIYGLMDLSELPEAEQQLLEERAGNAVDIAQKLDRASADAISLLGLGIGNRQLRIQAFERALELEPDHYMSYYRYAMQMKDDGKLQEAERLIKRAIQLSPMSARFRNELSGIFQLQGRAVEAQAQLEESERLNSRQNRCEQEV